MGARLLFRSLRVREGLAQGGDELEATVVHSKNGGPLVNVRRRTLGKPVPAEGEGGLFTQATPPRTCS